MTPKQQRFVEEYLVDLNASAAARRAGYSERTANRVASENLTKPDISAAIAAKRAEVSARTGRNIDNVMADIDKVRRSCMQTVIDPDTGTEVMVSPKEALKALELEGKHHGAFEKDNRQRNPAGSFDAGRFFADLFRKPGGPA